MRSLNTRNLLSFSFLLLGLLFYSGNSFAACTGYAGVQGVVLTQVQVVVLPQVQGVVFTQVQGVVLTQVQVVVLPQVQGVVFTQVQGVVLTQVQVVVLTQVLGDHAIRHQVVKNTINGIVLPLTVNKYEAIGICHVNFSLILLWCHFYDGGVACNGVIQKFRLPSILQSC